MQTYKQFLIQDNLRCYLDDHGNTIPMFPHTEFKSIEEIYKRIDRYWQEWELQERNRRDKNLGKSFEALKDDMDLSDEAREIEQQEFEDKLNQFFEMQNMGE